MRGGDDPATSRSVIRSARANAVRTVSKCSTAFLFQRRRGCRCWCGNMAGTPNHRVQRVNENAKAADQKTSRKVACGVDPVRPARRGVARVCRTA